MEVTIIVNDAPYGTEKAYNALRYASAILARGMTVNIFLMADSVAVAKAGQKVPQGYYNLEKMLVDLLKEGVKVKLCGTCCQARGIKQEEIIDGAGIGKMLDLADWTLSSDKIVTF